MTSNRKPNKWTVERRALLDKEWPVTDDRTGLLARLNELPGEPITRNQMDGNAASRGLRRPRPGIAPGTPRRGRTLDAAPVVAAPPPVEDGGPLAANFATIAGWAAERGVRFDGANMADVNRIRLRAGMRQFILDQTVR